MPRIIKLFIMRTGIICIETEFKVISKRKRRIDMDTESLLRFMHEGHQIPFIYRRVATKSELEYYLKQFSRPEYVKDYGILYFSFHGWTHSIYLEGDKVELTLNDLAEIGGSVFENRLVHFSSCFTLRGSSAITEDFKNESGAKFVSGYSKSVDSMKSAIHDICLFDTFIRYKQTPSIINRMETVYGGLSRELGFKIV